MPFSLKKNLLESNKNLAIDLNEFKEDQISEKYEDSEDDSSINNIEVEK
jgi:hypothetical protein